MARDQNFLLGNGERLARNHELRRQSRPKSPPYTFEQARARLGAKVKAAASWSRTLPAVACPHDEVVLRLAIHPRYIAKSDYPSALLQAAQLRPIGRRAVQVSPEAWGTKQHADTATTDEIFVATKRSSLERLAGELPNWTESHAGADELAQIERIEPFVAEEKIKAIPDASTVVLELVLHNANDPKAIELFELYATKLDAVVERRRHRVVGGLSFVPVKAPRGRVKDLARYSLVRVIRGMPTIRPVPNPILRTTKKAVKLPSDPPVDDSLRAVIFDGGIPEAWRSPLSSWVNYVEPAGIGPAVAELEEHGLAVTSSFLFGPLNKSGVVTGPVYCPVDHVRVLDSADGSDYMYYDVLDRILKHMDASSPSYRFVNLSLGPPLPISDDEVTLWTAELDSRLAHGHAVVTVAAGNDGDKDAAMQLNRIQPPSDGVNVISVGAATSKSKSWDRAEYSCVGPGRSPGFFKPDGVAFGGCHDELFLALGGNSSLVGCAGTSLAAPYALRTAAGVTATLSVPLSPLALKALLVHRAVRRKKQKQSDVGWGRFEADPNFLITCDDQEAIVVYQGELPLNTHLRAALPMPRSGISGKVRITATLAIAPEVDVENPSTYTRGGLEVHFRPHDGIFSDNNGKPSKEPITSDFFSKARVYRQSEAELRRDGHKWEPCLRASRTMDSADLRNPVFDIYYHHREKGQPHSDPRPIPYALIVSLRAKEVPDMYRRVLASYQNVLVPVQPKTRVRVPSVRVG